MGVVIKQTTNQIGWVATGGDIDTYLADIQFDSVAGTISFSIGGEEALILTDVAAGVNLLTLVGSATGVAPGLVAAGDDADVGILITPKGTGDTVFTAGDVTLTAGDVILTAGDLTLTSGDATLTSGDFTMTSGNALLSSGNLTLTSGDLTVSSGNTTLTGTCDVTGAFSAATVEAGSLVLDIADATDTLALTQATHANRVLRVLDATLAITLPEATGTGDSYMIVQGIAATSSTIVTADTANAGFHGSITGSDTDADAAYNWAATGAQDTITYDGTATGGKLYDWVRVTDVATDVWLLEGNIKQSGGSEVTPLSSAA
jgi:hypothetical protein